MENKRADVFNEIVVVVNGELTVNIEGVIQSQGIDKCKIQENEEELRSEYLKVFGVYVQSKGELEILKCTIPFLDAYRSLLKKESVQSEYIKISEIMQISKAVKNYLYKEDSDTLQSMTNTLAVITIKQSKDRTSFVFKYSRDAKRLYRTLQEHITSTIELLNKLHHLTDVEALRFMYFLWTEYSTVPSNLGNNALTVYLNEFEVFIKQL